MSFESLELLSFSRVKPLSPHTNLVLGSHCEQPLDDIVISVYPRKMQGKLVFSISIYNSYEITKNLIDSVSNCFGNVCRDLLTALSPQQAIYL